MSDCHRCGTAVSLNAITSGDAVILDGSTYCDPCSDVLFGLLSPDKAPKPRISAVRSVGDTVEADPVQIDALEDVEEIEDLGDMEELEDVSLDEADAIDLEDVSIEEPDEVDAPLVEAVEDIDTGDVDVVEELDVEEAVEEVPEVLDTDTGTATVEVEAQDVESFEDIDPVDVDLEAAEPEVVEEPEAVEEAEPEAIVDEVESVEDVESVEEIAEVETGEDLPDYMEEGVAEEPAAPLLDETEEEKESQVDRQRKKQAIDALKVKPKAHTKGGKKSRKAEVEVSPEAKAEEARARSNQRAKGRDKAAISKKRNLIIIGVASFLCLALGGGYVYVKFFKKAEVVYTPKPIPTYEAQQNKVAELYAIADKGFAELEAMGDSDVEARNEKIRAVKTLYNDIKQFGTTWYETVEADKRLTNDFREEFDRMMQRAGERAKYLSTLIKHEVD